MPHLPQPIGSDCFSRLESFEPRLAELASLRARMEIECAAGALLHLEEAFKSLPASLSGAALSFEGDHEGFFLSQVLLPSRHGEPVWTNTILLAMHRSQDGRREMSPAETLIAQEFAGWDMDDIKTGGKAFDDALYFFHGHAPSLFYGCADAGPDRTAICHAGDAIAIGRELGLIQSAALIERSRLGSECAAPSKQAPARSI